MSLWRLVGLKLGRRSGVMAFRLAGTSCDQLAVKPRLAAMGTLADRTPKAGFPHAGVLKERSRQLRL